MRLFRTIAWSAILLLITSFLPAQAEDPFERPPISYSQAAPENIISRLQARLESGEARLEFRDKLGYLPALLQAVRAPVESQMLVFSQTSLQRQRISPRTPRAVYFSDDVYVGFCQGGEVLEVSAVDPQLGAVFYTLDQEQAAHPRFVRQTDNCLTCHSSSRTESVPGHLVRSLFVDSRGQPLLSAGSFAVDYRTPLKDRWGGWYVTGTHGAQTHLGNLVISAKEVPRPVENAQGHNVTTLDDRLAVARYLSPHSDIVALMVFEHQTLVHNCLTQANYTARQALFYEAEMNRALGKPTTERLESTSRRIQTAGDRLVDALLFVDEAPLTAPIQGTSGFAEKFSALGPHDGRGRSLRDFDLERRVFKYPCSYLIYSPSFQALPEEMRSYVWQRLWNILAGRNAAAARHLSADDRQAIVEILRETAPNLPSYWRASLQTTSAGTTAK